MSLVLGEYGGTTFLVTTHLRRQMLADVLHLKSYAERNRSTDDLGSCTAQLQKIPKNTPFLFCNTLGGLIIDHRIAEPWAARVRLSGVCVPVTNTTASVMGHHYAGAEATIGPALVLFAAVNHIASQQKGKRRCSGSAQ